MAILRPSLRAVFSQPLEGSWSSSWRLLKAYVDSNWASKIDGNGRQTQNIIEHVIEIVLKDMLSLSAKQHGMVRFWGALFKPLEALEYVSYVSWRLHNRCQRALKQNSFEHVIEISWNKQVIFGANQHGVV